MRKNAALFIHGCWVMALIFLAACNPTSKNEGTATINLIIDDEGSNAASVTGKELLWSRSQIKRKDSTGLIQFNANVKNVDLLLIKTNNTYKSFLCFLEENQELNVVYKHHTYSITGNSIAARQNRLLVEIDQKRKELNSNLRDLETGQSAAEMHQVIENMIQYFISQNKDVSVDFIQYVKFNNRYYYFSQSLGLKDKSPDVYHEYAPSELEILKNTLIDSDYDLAYLSSYYRVLLHRYMDYLRIYDSGFQSQTTENPVKNERILAQKLKSKELRQYQMAVSLTDLLQVDCQLDLEKEIKENTGFWSNLLLYEYKAVSNRNYVKHSIDVGKAYAWYKPLTSGQGEHLDTTKLKKKWTYLAIGTNPLGYSPYEAFYLEKLKASLPQLQCLCVSTSEMVYPQKRHKNIPLVYSQQQALENVLLSKGLPYSLLINPAGEIVCVNLPRASTGMLEPMVRQILGVN